MYIYIDIYRIHTVERRGNGEKNASRKNLPRRISRKSEEVGLGR